MNKRHNLVEKEKRIGSPGSHFSLIVLIIIVICYGCSGTLKQYKHAEIQTKNLKRIAVLPMENLTGNEYADEKIRSLVIMDLLSRDVNVIEPGEVMRVYKELRISPYQPVSRRNLQNLGEMLEVEVVLKGSVGTYDIKKGVSVSYPEVSTHLTLVDIESGDILWSAWHTSGGASIWTRHFGAEGTTLDETARQVIKESFDSLF
ncbi:MAG: hypothetical protein JSW20_05285 [Nitrospiraceae bacterium]|nr:MAG: hypothetical protein JSW20_05285 [Nitrospiraceae bacterium]